MNKIFCYLILSVLLFNCKNETKNTNHDIKSDTEVLTKAVKQKDLFTNLYVSKNEDNIDFDISSINYEYNDKDELEFKFYLSGNFDKYDGPRYPLYLHIFPVKQEVEFMAENRKKYNYENYSFDFRVLKDKKGSYIKGVFYTGLTEASLIKLIILDKKENTKIVQKHFKNVLF